MNQNKLASKKTPNMVLIPTDSMTMYGGDGLYTHWSKKGYSIWANRVADSICARNWGPVNKCGVTVGAGPSLHRWNMKFPSSTQKVLFDGSNWSVFDRTGEISGIYLPNGKVFYTPNSAGLRSKNLRPGVYIIRSNVAK